MKNINTVTPEDKASVLPPSLKNEDIKYDIPTTENANKNTLN